MRTFDGWFAITASLFYIIGGLLIGCQLWDPPDEFGLERDLAGYMLMPIVFLLTHLWYRVGVDAEKSLHVPSVVAVSIFAVLMPLVSVGVVGSG